MPFQVSITRTRRSNPIAECETCGNAVLATEPTRAEVRAHVRATGHTVYVVVEEGTYYKPEGNDR